MQFTTKREREELGSINIVLGVKSSDILESASRGQPQQCETVCPILRIGGQTGGPGGHAAQTESLFSTAQTTAWPYTHTHIHLYTSTTSTRPEVSGF